MSRTSQGNRNKTDEGHNDDKRSKWGTQRKTIGDETTMLEY